MYPFLTNCNVMKDKMTKSVTTVVTWVRGVFCRVSDIEVRIKEFVNAGIAKRTLPGVVMEPQNNLVFDGSKRVSAQSFAHLRGSNRKKRILKKFYANCNLPLSTLAANSRKFLAGSVRDRVPKEVLKPRIPIWLQLSIATMLVLAVSIGILSYVIKERQKEKLYNHVLKLSTVSLKHIVQNAKIPLLTDDALTLNMLTNNVASVDGHFYAFIINNDKIIKAHTDHEKIDKPFQPFDPAGEVSHKDGVTYFYYTRPDNTRILNLSMPIIFQQKKLGEAHVGLSVDFMDTLFIDESAFLFWATFIIIIFGMAIAVVFSLRFSQPFSKLVSATAEIARGNYQHRVDIKRNDELGTLGDAFNRMGRELSQQSLIRESFGKYVGPEILSMITKSPEQTWLKGRKKNASILFADIRGFTAYSEEKEPEEVVEKLNEFFAIATSVILKEGGYIDKFIGDSVLAVFGVPVCQEDHAERCLRAAVAIQQALAEADGANNPLLQSVGIGIASGVVVAGNIGSAVKMEYTVIGDSVNIASYLNGLAAAGEIIIDTNTEHLNDLVEFEPLPPQKIKGRKEMVEVFRIKAMKTKQE